MLSHVAARRGLPSRELQSDPVLVSRVCQLGLHPDQKVGKWHSIRLSSQTPVRLFQSHLQFIASSLETMGNMGNKC